MNPTLGDDTTQGTPTATKNQIDFLLGGDIACWERLVWCIHSSAAPVDSTIEMPKADKSRSTWEAGREGGPGERGEGVMMVLACLGVEQIYSLRFI